MSAMLIKRVTVEQVRIPDLGERIKEAREKSSKSMGELCQEVGFSRTYWYDIENGFIKGGLPIETLQKIEKALGVDFGVKFD
jgi:transcriptional regulator with XRE-family HTH domain